jgi:gas vesicle protein
MLLGLVAGAVVGSAAGLLLAPESGRQLRADLENYTSQVRKEVQQAADDRRQELEAQLAHLRGEIISE